MQRAGAASGTLHFSSFRNCKEDETLPSDIFSTFILVYFMLLFLPLYVIGLLSLPFFHPKKSASLLHFFVLGATMNANLNVVSVDVCEDLNTPFDQEHVARAVSVRPVVLVHNRY